MPDLRTRLSGWPYALAAALAELAWLLASAWAYQTDNLDLFEFPGFVTYLPSLCFLLIATVLGYRRGFDIRTAVLMLIAVFVIGVSGDLQQGDFSLADGFMWILVALMFALPMLLGLAAGVGVRALARPRSRAS